MFGGIYTVVRHSLFRRLEVVLPELEHAGTRPALQFGCDVAAAALVPACLHCPPLPSLARALPLV